MNDQAIEQEVQAKGLNAPRVTLADLDANIADTEIVKHISKTGQVLRWAILTTQNGFAVVGKPSVAVSPENDNAEIGEKVAIENSRAELWPLMGYELRTRLAQREKAATGQPNTGLTFGQALEQAKAGFRIAREGWNGKGMFVFIIQGSNDIAKLHGYGFGELMGEPKFRDSMFMRTVDNQLVPWTVSQSDALANDWMTVL